MKKRKGILAQVFVVAVSMALLCSCGKSEKSEEETAKRTVRIGSIQVYTTALTSIAAEKGYLQECLPENVDYTYTKLASGPDSRDALVSNQVDLCDMATMTYMMSLENDLPISIVCATGSTPIFLYSASDKVKSLNDFTKTNRIAITNRATTLHAAFLGTCKDKLGDALALDQCLVPIPAADALAALNTENYDFDGAIFSFPNKIKADQVENLVLLEDMTEVINKYGDGGVMVTRDDYLSENKDIFDGYIKALEKAKQFIHEQPDQAAEILSGVYDVEPEHIKEAFKTMAPDYKVINYDSLGALLYDSGVLTKKPTPFAELNNYENIPK